MSTCFLLLLVAPLVGYVIYHALGVVLSSIARQSSCCYTSTKPLAGKIAILYLSCNDFNPSACRTLLSQEGVDFDVFILDDSSQPSEKKRVDTWVRSQDKTIQVVRRSDRVGYKGGAINNWLAMFGDPTVYPYILVVDADEHIPRDFTCRLLECLASGKYAFVQGCHLGTAGIHTLFQALLHPQVECEWLHQVPARNLSGVPPMLGHGVLLRTESLIRVGGFPNLISEDLAFTILLAEKGLVGVVATNVIGQEAFPQSYRAYWRRRCRWIKADAEIVRKMLRKIWQSRIGLVPRLDLSARELRLTIASVYWLLLVATAILSFFKYDKDVILPPLAWALLPCLLIPALPTLGIERLNIARRIIYVCTMTFVGAATISLHPIASWLGLTGRGNFEPTGSRHVQEIFFSSYLIWELFSGFLFFTAGILAVNWSLAAVGFAILCSPIMRSRWGSETLILGTIIFWVFLFSQICMDIISGFLPIDHLLVLVGLTITLL